MLQNYRFYCFDGIHQKMEVHVAERFDRKSQDKCNKWLDALVVTKPACHAVISLSDAFKESLEKSEQQTANRLVRAIDALDLQIVYLTHDVTDLYFINPSEHDDNTPSNESIERFIQEVIFLVKNCGPRIAMHCGSGNGRSGMMIAALYIYMQLKQCSSKTECEKLHTSITYDEPLSEYDFEYMPARKLDCNQLVVEAINFAKTQGSNPSPEAVEVPAQLKALTRFSNYLLEKYLKPGFEQKGEDFVFSLPELTLAQMQNWTDENGDASTLVRGPSLTAGKSMSLPESVSAKEDARGGTAAPSASQ